MGLMIGQLSGGSTREVRVDDGGNLFVRDSEVAGNTAVAPITTFTSGAASKAVSANTTMKFTAALDTTPDATVRYRVAAAGGDATTVATATGMVFHGGSFTVSTGDTAKTVYMILVDGDGVIMSAAGALDRVMVATV